MDSGNSGSMQSSSGGDEEFDSRAGFLTTTSTNQPPNSSTLFFDPALSNYLSASADPFTTRPSPTPNPNSLLMNNNLDMGWPSSSSTRTHYTANTHFSNTSLMASSSSTLSATPHQQHHHHGSASFSPLQTNQTGPHNSNDHHHNHQNSSSTTSGVLRASSSSSPLLHPPPDQQRVNSSPKNSKKRSRASRRAPTHVLTTDTSNFRAMVQEFTGIPAPPFSASPFPRTRFDLFNTSSTATTTMRSALDQTPSYLLRPFAQKPNPPPFLSSSSSAAATNANTVSTTTVTDNTSSNSTAAPSNYQLLSELGLSKQSPHHQNLLNMQNPSLTFQSLLQSASPPPQLHHPNPSATHNSQPKMGVMEQFGTQQHSSGMINPNLVLRSDDDNNNNTSSWGDGGGGGGGGSNNGDHHHQDHNLRSFNGNYENSSQRQTANGCKMNYSLGTSSSDFIAEKGSENNNGNSNNNHVNSSRGEGMVDSWICSSD